MIAENLSPAGQVAMKQVTPKLLAWLFGDHATSADISTLLHVTPVMQNTTGVSMEIVYPERLLHRDEVAAAIRRYPAVAEAVVGPAFNAMFEDPLFAGPPDDSEHAAHPATQAVRASVPLSCLAALSPQLDLQDRTTAMDLMEGQNVTTALRTWLYAHYNPSFLLHAGVALPLPGRWASMQLAHLSMCLHHWVNKRYIHQNELGAIIGGCGSLLGISEENSRHCATSLRSYWYQPAAHKLSTCLLHCLGWGNAGMLADSLERTVTLAKFLRTCPKLTDLPYLLERLYESPYPPLSAH